MTTDAHATVYYCGNQLLDTLIASARDDCRLPACLIADDAIIPDWAIRAALVVAVQRLEKP